MPIFDPTLVQYFIQIPHIIYCCPLSAYDKWWLEQKKSPHFREKYLVLSYLKSKPFQTVTKRYWCLFCVVIYMSVQLAETLTWMPEKLKTVHEIVHKHTNFKLVLYFAGWFSKISQIKQLAQCMVSSRFLRRVSLQNWNFHPNTPHTHIFVIFF